MLEKLKINNGLFVFPFDFTDGFQMVTCRNYIVDLPVDEIVLNFESVIQVIL
jgi:hypothetical protein